MQGAVIKLYKWLVKIKMKAKVENGYGASKVARNRRVRSGIRAIVVTHNYTGIPLKRGPKCSKLIKQCYCPAAIPRFSMCINKHVLSIPPLCASLPSAVGCQMVSVKWSL